jgi:hypothetical protein
VTAIFFASDFWSTSGLGKDILINLVAIPVNIAITVYLVERLVKRRDETASKTRSGLVEWELGDIADELLSALGKSGTPVAPRDLLVGGRDLQLLCPAKTERSAALETEALDRDALIRICRNIQTSSIRLHAAEPMIGAAASGEVVENALRFVATCDVAARILGEWDPAGNAAPPVPNVSALLKSVLVAADDMLTRIESRWASPK